MHFGTDTRMQMNEVKKQGVLIKGTAHSIKQSLTFKADDVRSKWFFGSVISQ